MNIVAIMGRLTSDPDYRKLTTGKAVCNFTLAVDRSFSQGADFISCVAWEKTANFINDYFKKGMKMAVTGSLQTRSYQETDTGKNRTVYEVVISTADFCEKKQESGTDAPQRTRPAKDTFSGFEPVDDQGDLPF